MKTQSEIIWDEEHFYIQEKGSLDPERCWILSNRDIWYINPHYKGKFKPHPDSYD